jgi:ribosomal-protein-alanine N-acetyltransferase
MIISPSLQHGRVGLRLIRPADARVLERLLNDNRAWLQQWEATYPGFIRPSPNAFSLKPVIKNLLATHKAKTGVPFVVTFDDQIVGQLSVSSIIGGSVSSAQMGYWIAQNFAGRGIIPAAVALAVDYCMTQLGLHRMEICIRPENVASLRVVEKLGFRYERMRRNYIHIDNRWCDHECFALTQEDLPKGLIAALPA